MAETPHRFNELVLAWLRQEVPEADAIEYVRGDGTDWEGDTEGGFYSRFSVEVKYRKTDGSTGYRTVSGDDMHSLWDWVVVKGFGDG